MKLPSLLLCLSLLATSGATAFGAAEDAGRVALQPGQLAPEWSQLLETLAAPTALRAAFVERRVFSFRAEAVELRGVLRLHPEHGLSLHYEQPEAQTVIINDRGVWMRDGRGRTRAAPAAAVEQTGPLRDLLRFDLVQISRRFVVTGQIAPDAWQLWLEPRSRRDGGAITLAGRGESLEQLVLQPTAKRRVEIALGATELDPTFTAEEIGRYFRP